MNITADVSFCRKYLYSMGEKYCKFRGTGHISADEETVKISGKRIYKPTILRGVVILLFLVVLKYLLINTLLFFPILLVLYYLSQYVILHKEDLSVPWAEINKYEVDAKNKFIAFSIANNSDCSPIIFKTEKFEEIASVLRNKMSERGRTSSGLTALEERYDEEIESMGKSMDKFLNSIR